MSTYEGLVNFPVLKLILLGISRKGNIMRTFVISKMVVVSLPQFLFWAIEFTIIRKPKHRSMKSKYEIKSYSALWFFVTKAVVRTVSFPFMTLMSKPLEISTSKSQMHSLSYDLHSLSYFIHFSSPNFTAHELV